MTNPRLFLFRMLMFVLCLLVVIAALREPLVTAFSANRGLNGLIIGVFLIGIVYIFRQVLVLRREVNWIDTFRTGRPGMSVQAPPRLLAPMASMLGDRGQNINLSALSLRSLLDGISARLDEQRDISRYLIGLLIFLGLLGTFWGLLATINSVAAVINGLSVGSGDLSAVFADLKRGLQEPLSGMGTAFSSSLFGLAGSLALGFLELQASQAQNRFYNDLEDWLSGQTRLSTGGGIATDGEQSVPAYVQALLEQTADSLENLQRTLDRGEESRISSNNTITSLAEKLGALTDHMRAEQSLLERLAESQLELKPVLVQIAESAQSAFGDESTRNHVRNIDIHLSRMLEEMATGRAETVQELRNDLRVLSRTLAAVAEKPERA